MVLAGVLIANLTGEIVWTSGAQSALAAPTSALIADRLLSGQAGDDDVFRSGDLALEWTLDHGRKLLVVAAYPHAMPLPKVAVLLGRICETFAADDAGAFDAQFPALLAQYEAAHVRVGVKGEGKGQGKGPQRPPKGAKRGASGKEARTWDGAYSAQAAAALDFSESAAPATSAQSDDSADESVDASDLVDAAALGSRTAAGHYEPAELVAAPPSENAARAGGLLGTWLGGLSLTSRQLTVADLAPVIAKMREHLISKNVAAATAASLVESVQTQLEGTRLGGLTTVASAVNRVLGDALARVLSPSSSGDLLRDILAKKRRRQVFAIVFCGVNGVGKSTNLSKVCFWLLQNKLRVLIAACDTFRSGAVEQLRTHVRRLSALAPPEKPGDPPNVALYEQGYGKDAPAIARNALQHAAAGGFDVALIDTAGRMQDNEPLMRSLAKLIAVNQPDRIVFVGEALVGNEAVDQLQKFNAALRGLAPSSSARAARTIDGIVLTKFDTIDDKVGAAVSMAHITGKPILFVGTGQTYSDLKRLSVDAIVATLLRG